MNGVNTFRDAMPAVVIAVRNALGQRGLAVTVDSVSWTKRAVAVMGEHEVEIEEVQVHLTISRLVVDGEQRYFAGGDIRSLGELTP